MTKQDNIEKTFTFDLPNGDELKKLFPRGPQGRRIAGKTKSSQTIAEIMQAFIDQQRGK